MCAARVGGWSVSSSLLSPLPPLPLRFNQLGQARSVVLGRRRGRRVCIKKRRPSLPDTVDVTVSNSTANTLLSPSYLCFRSCAPFDHEFPFPPHKLWHSYLSPTHSGWQLRSWWGVMAHNYWAEGTMLLANVNVKSWTIRTFVSRSTSRRGRLKSSTRGLLK